MLTLEELEEIEKITEAATPGPWKEEIDWNYEGINTVSWACGPENRDENDEKSQSTKDAEFIARARSAVPALTKEVRRLRAEVERLQNEYKTQSEILYSTEESENNSGADNVRLYTEIGDLKKQLAHKIQFYSPRYMELQKLQKYMPEPWRTLVCDILANGYIDLKVRNIDPVTIYGSDAGGDE